MMPRFSLSLPAHAFRIAAAFLALAWLSAPAEAASRAAARKTGPAAAASPAGVLDTATVRKYYLDGDFEPAIQLLEATLRSKSAFSHDDSAFVFKHLGVMYAAKYETREKGKHYMHRLLEVEPTARILDMYASDMIYMIFKNIQDEFESSRRRLVRADSALGGGHGAGSGKEPPPRDDGPEARRDSAPGKRSAALWLGAGAAVAVAAGAATWYYFSDEPKIVHEDFEPK